MEDRVTDVGRFQTPKMLCFRIDEQEYAVPILTVVEIISPPPITRLPNVSGAVRGVINLRGRVITVVDARTRLGMGAVEIKAETVIIILRRHGSDGPTDVGLMVDTVQDVLDIPPDRIEPPSPLAVAAHVASIVTGVAQVQKRILYVVDVGRLIGLESVGG